jgi:hypothetical protein
MTKPPVNPEVTEWVDRTLKIAKLAEEPLAEARKSDDQEKSERAAPQPELPFSFDAWADAVWLAMSNLAQEDTAVKMLNAHTVREFCKASWVALSKAGGLPSDPRASDHLTEQQRQAITDANAGRMDIDDD